ncbi:hypothetical protein WDU94_007766 [Cyamophila willieti]
MLKAVILIGGPLKGTRFRPLSLDAPKPLFPVAGLPMIQHHIEACVQVPNLKEIIILGYYPSADLQQFVLDMVQEYKISIRYLQEFIALGTGGGIFHFRDQIRCGNPDAFFVLNGDVCADFALNEMLEFHRGCPNSLVTVMATEATRQQSVYYGCIVRNQQTSEITHYVEKPSTFVSTLVNCGVYVFSLEIFQNIGAVFKRKEDEFYSRNYVKNGKDTDFNHIQLEKELIMPLAGTGRAYVYQTSKWWSQLKSAGSAIYANRHYLQLYRSRHPSRLLTSETAPCKIIGDVYVHSSATVDPTAIVGPNVSIDAGSSVGPGVRIKESIILQGASIGSHSLVLNSIVGRNAQVGHWSRVEGTPCDPNPNKAFAKMDNPPLFNSNGKLNPSITILGDGVTVPGELIVLNSIILPYKELSRSFKNEILL